MGSWRTCATSSGNLSRSIWEQDLVTAGPAAASSSPRRRAELNAEDGTCRWWAEASGSTEVLAPTPCWAAAEPAGRPSPSLRWALDADADAERERQGKTTDLGAWDGEGDTEMSRIASLLVPDF